VVPFALAGLSLSRLTARVRVCQRDASNGSGDRRTPTRRAVDRAHDSDTRRSGAKHRPGDRRFQRKGGHTRLARGRECFTPSASTGSRHPYRGWRNTNRAGHIRRLPQEFVHRGRPWPASRRGANHVSDLGAACGLLTRRSARTWVRRGHRLRRGEGDQLALAAVRTPVRAPLPRSTHLPELPDRYSRRLPSGGLLRAVVVMASDRQSQRL
jgi:hypothetical protein